MQTTQDFTPCQHNQPAEACATCHYIKKNKPYTIEEDHAEIKKQIKQWESAIDETLASVLTLKASDSDHGKPVTDYDEIIGNLEHLSHEMTAINI